MKTKYWDFPLMNKTSELVPRTRTSTSTFNRTCKETFCPLMTFQMIDVKCIETQRLQEVATIRLTGLVQWNGVKLVLWVYFTHLMFYYPALTRHECVCCVSAYT